jgi:diguanylate cyclase (GGDEF)-like protein
MWISATTRTALLAALVSGIGVMDYFSGPDVGFSLLYLAPIAWSAWQGDRSASLALALLASALWLIADIAWHGLNVVSAWNGFTRFSIYMSIAWLTSRVWTDQQQLRALNARLQELLEHEQQLARTDALTALPNRRLFVDELRRAAARSHRAKTPLAVAYLDLDRFKAFNDRSGHLAGDAVLKAVGKVLAGHVRGNDLAARLGGDEFGVLLDNCTEQTARITGTRLLDELKTTLADLTKGEVGMSIGVACFDGPPLSPETVIDHADAAMYCAKGQGTNGLFVTHLSAERATAPQR